MINQSLTNTNTTAMAAIAPVSEVIELVKLYQQAVDAEGRFFFDQRFDQEKFEAEILARKDKYLDLLLSKCVSQIDSARELWKRATTDGNKNDSSYEVAIKENLVEAIGPELILGDRFGLGSSHIFTEIGQEVFPNLNELTDLGFAAFRSEKNKALIRCFVRGAHKGEEKNPFIECGELFKLQAWQTIAQNDSINVEKTSSDGPDLMAWDVFDGIRNFIQDTPTDHHHLDAIYRLVCKLDPENFRLGSDFDTDNFINKWSSEESRWPKEDEKHSFDRRFDNTDLSLNHEMIGLLVAKFQPEFRDKVNFNSVKNALKSTHLPSKAAFFGRLSPSTLTDTLNNGALEYTWLFFTLQNSYLYRDSKAVSAVEEYLHDDSCLSKFFKKQKQKHQVGIRETSHIISGESPLQEDMDTIISMLARIRSDHEYAKEAVEHLKDQFKTYRWWFLIIAVIYWFKH